MYGSCHVTSNYALSENGKKTKRTFADFVLQIIYLYLF